MHFKQSYFVKPTAIIFICLHPFLGPNTIFLSSDCAPLGEKTLIISIWLQFNCTYFEPPATISILLHLFWANVTGIETIWFFMFRANFNNFNLTAPFLSGVSYFFCYALPIFRANFTKQWTLSNQLQFFPAICVCAWDDDLRVFQDDCICSEPHIIISL